MVLAPNSDQNLSNLFDNLAMTGSDTTLENSLTALNFALLKLPSESVYETITNTVLESLIRVSAVLSSGESSAVYQDVLERVVSCIPLSHLLKRFPGEVLLALNGSVPAPKLIFLRYVRKAITEDESTVADISATNSPIFIAVCRCLSDKETSVFHEAKSVVVCVAKSCSDLTILFASSLVVDTLKQMAGKDSIIRFRLHEVTSDLCQLSPEVLGLCDKMSLVTLILNELNSHDVLTQLNAFEILTQLASSSDYCLTYLYEKGVLQTLYSMLEHCQENPDGSFIFPAVIKFFGHLARLRPKDCCNSYPKFLNAIFHMVINYQLLEIGQRLLAFDTLGLLASTPEGKGVLSNYDTQMQRCMKCFCQSIREGPMDMRVRHLEALISVLKLEPADQTDELLALNEKWFSWLDPSPMEVLFYIFKQPFVAIHCATGELFKDLAVQKWGQKVMFRQAGFFEYMLNRSTEATMEGRHVKFEIVDLLVKSPTITETVDTDLIQRLKQYQVEGPYYIHGQLDVAMADA